MNINFQIPDPSPIGRASLPGLALGKSIQVKPIKGKSRISGTNFEPLTNRPRRLHQRQSQKHQCLQAPYGFTAQTTAVPPWFKVRGSRFNGSMLDVRCPILNPPCPAPTSDHRRSSAVNCDPTSFLKAVCNRLVIGPTLPCRMF